MGNLLEVLRRERRAGVFLLAYTQSALGNGAANVALLVLAYERLHSPWAITLVLLAFDLPPGLLGPVFGAVADRFSRRWCAVAADVARALAFLGIALIPGIVATTLLTVVAGAALALFNPAILAALPTLVDKERVPAATALFGGATDIGRTLGPLLAGISFPLIGATGVMMVNAVTFAVSACVLAVLPFGAAVVRGAGESPMRFLQEVREGLVFTVRLPFVRVVLVASTALILVASMVNVAELLFAHKLGAGASGFAVLMAAQGVGVVAGSLSGARKGGLQEYQARYLLGALAIAASLIGLTAVPVYVAAIPVFVLAGLGNGVLLVHERLIFQAAVPNRLLGRAFAVLDAMGSWAFGIAYVLGGALISTIGVRATIGVAGAGALGVWFVSAALMRRERPLAERRIDLADPAPASSDP